MIRELNTNGIADHKLIEYWDIDTLRLNLIKSIIETEDTDLGIFESVKQLRKQCLNPPDTITEKMEVVNELLNAHGVESIQVSEELYQDKYWGNAIGLYINMGDTYDLTIIYDVIELEWQVTTWGDYYETKEAELKAELDSEES
jgi:hypothetical protein